MLYLKLDMPVIASARKKMRQDRKRTKENQIKKEKLKNLLKKARKTPTQENIQAAISFLDKVAKRSLIHKNKASHLKSSLAKLKPSLKQEKTSPKKPKKPTSSKVKVTFDK